ncbi:MAG: Fe-S-containing protein [Geobacteraceae bacterium]
MASSSFKKIVIAGAVTVALLVGALSVFAFSFGKYEKVKATNGTITLPAAKLANGKARFYKFEAGGKDITFFAVKAADGSIKTAFDACDACYRDKKGYEQQSDKMNCKNCNQKFAINRLGPNASGGCNPGYLPHTQNGNSISISVTDLKGGARYF